MTTLKQLIRQEVNTEYPRKAKRPKTGHLTENPNGDNGQTIKDLKQENTFLKKTISKHCCKIWVGIVDDLYRTQEEISNIGQCIPVSVPDNSYEQLQLHGFTLREIHLRYLNVFRKMQEQIDYLLQANLNMENDEQLLSIVGFD